MGGMAMEIELTQEFPEKVLSQYSTNQALEIGRVIRKNLPGLLPLQESIAHRYNPEDIILTHPGILGDLGEGYSLNTEQFFNITLSEPRINTTPAANIVFDTKILDVHAREVIHKEEQTEPKTRPLRRAILNTDGIAEEIQKIRKAGYSADEEKKQMQRLLAKRKYLYGKKEYKKYTGPPIPRDITFQKRLYTKEIETQDILQEIWERQRFPDGTKFDKSISLTFIRSAFGAKKEKGISYKDQLIRTIGISCFQALSPYCTNLFVEFIELDSIKEIALRDESQFFNRRRGKGRELFADGEERLKEALQISTPTRRICFLIVQGNHTSEDKQIGTFLDNVYDTTQYALKFFGNSTLVDLSKSKKVLEEVQKDIFRYGETFLYVPFQWQTAQKEILRILKYVYEKLPQILED